MIEKKNKLAISIVLSVSVEEVVITITVDPKISEEGIITEAVIIMATFVVFAAAKALADQIEMPEILKEITNKMLINHNKLNNLNSQL